MAEEFYKAKFPKGTRVQIADREELEQFMVSWKYHHPLQSWQLSFAGQVATIQSVGFYHGGDVIYELSSIPGTWHQVCLTPIEL